MNKTITKLIATTVVLLTIPVSYTVLKQSDTAPAPFKSYQAN